MAAVTLTAPQTDAAGPRLVSASFIPERGLMLSKLVMRLADGRDFELVADADPTSLGDDFNGNASFGFGGAFLIPYANRITGRPLPGRRIAAEVCGQPVALPANWSGKAPGSEPYAMHGLILDKTVEVVEQEGAELRGRLKAHDFGVGWPSLIDLSFHMRLTGEALSVAVRAVNVGPRPTLIGIGWHPWFALASGDRRQAKLHVAAAKRLEVGDYDAVLPTGRILDLAGTPQDFSDPAGKALSELYLDDCFVELSPKDGVVASVRDPAAGFGLSLSAEGPIKAVQVYAPPDRPVVVVEPQFNWADPLSDIWPPATDTGMAWLEPEGDVAYGCEVRVFEYAPARGGNVATR